MYLTTKDERDAIAKKMKERIDKFARRSSRPLMRADSRVRKFSKGKVYRHK
jgi:hypothetical protein